MIPLLLAAIIFTPADSPSSIQSRVSAAPEGETFQFRPGTYRGVSIRPRNNQRFIGDPGAVLNGARLAAPVREGKYWPFSVTLNGQRNGKCGTDTPLCADPEEVFYDSVRLQPVKTLAEVAAGKYVLDRASGKAYLSGSGAGHTVEISTTRSAFYGSAVGVYISGIIIEKYASPGQMGAIGEQFPSSGWVIENCCVRQNHGAGIMAGDGWRISGCQTYNNGQLGMRGTGSNILVENSGSYGNNRCGYSTSWESGGAKFLNTTGLTVRDSEFSNNTGSGLWVDMDSIDALIERNRFQHNTGPGVHYEISYRATIRDNLFECNGRYGVRSFGLKGSQLQIYNSADVSIETNTLVSDGSSSENGIGVINENRGAGIYGAHAATGIRVRNNKITHGGAEARNGVICTHNCEWLKSSGNNQFDSNSYTVKAPGQSWYWTGELPGDWSAFRAAGQEAGGTVRVQ